MFATAYKNGSNCLVLSAAGCGAYRNPPDHIAKLFHQVVQQFNGLFHTIVFSIFNDKNSYKINKLGNLKCFEFEFGIKCQTF